MIADSSALVWRAADGRHDRVILDALERCQAASPWDSPQLAMYEVGNVIHRKRRKEFDGPIAHRIQLFRTIVGYTNLLPTMPSAGEEIARLSEALGISFYDATFLELANRSGTALLTADRGMAAHAEALGIPAYLMPRDAARLAADFPEGPPEKA